MGKFTQSVKRIVQEVKEDGTQGKPFCRQFKSVWQIIIS